VPERFSIAQVTPFPREDDHEVNAFVTALSGELASRGHRVLLLGPSRSPELVRQSRRLIRAARDAPEELFDADGGVRELAVGELLPFNRRGLAPSPPVDVGRTIEQVLSTVTLDFVHVHEPFAPSASSVALRHSRALNVGSFHAPTERVLSTQVARRFVELFFGRLDARTAAFEATRDLMGHYFPAPYRLLRPGAAGAERAPANGGPLKIAFCAQEERAALRLFLRALRRLPDDLEWEATVFAPTGAAPTGALRSRVRDRVRVVTAAETTEDRVLAEADVAVAASLGQAPAPGLVVRALGAGAIPVCSRLRAYEEVLGDGELGLCFEPGDVDVLAAQLDRIGRSPELREQLAAAVSRDARGAVVEPGSRRGGGHLRRARRPAAPARGGRHAARAAAPAPVDRRRPAHAHGPLGRLRHAGGRAPGDRARAGPRRDRRHRPQRDLRRARRPLEGGRVRDQGDRRRGGQDRQPRAR
jgi:glycosyltransferase involved in cell wall biosynthesis